MKLRFVLLGVLLAALILAGCQPAATPTAAPSNPAGGPGSYPSPQVQAKPAQSQGPIYPTLKNGSEVTWEQGTSMILNGEVKQLIIDQASTLTILLKDGRSMTAKPVTKAQVDEIVKICGDLCKDVSVQAP